MTPYHLEAVALKLYPFRWWLAVTTALYTVALLVIGQFVPNALPIAVALAGPFLCLPWVIFCACSWFHPTSGNLRLKGGKRISVWLNQVARWYAAAFTTLSAIIALAVWPTLAILWL